MSPLAGFVMFVLFVIMTVSLVINVYYYDNLNTINSEIFRATRLTAVDSLGLKVKETKSLVQNLISERQEMERRNLELGQELALANCKLAPIDKLVEAARLLPNPFAIPKVMEAVSLAMRPCR